MNFQIGYYDEEHDEFEAAEDFLGHGQIFYLAEVLSEVMPAVRQPDPEDAPTRAAFDAFTAYLSTGREAGDQAFREYYDFFFGPDEEPEATAKGETPEFTADEPLMIPRAEDFDPDARAFIGKLILNRKVVSPEEATTLAGGLIWLGAVLKRQWTECEQANPESREQYQFALDAISLVADYAMGAVELGRSFGFFD